jgi:hypothetical protein
MANLPNPSIPATAVNQDASQTPGAPSQALPFTLPEAMTAAQAEQRLVELRTDADWQKRWLDGDARANTEFDALTRKAVGQQPAAPAPVPDQNAEALKALGPPPTVKDYKIDVKDPTTGWPVQIDAAERAVIDGVLLPAAHNLGLSQGDVAMIGDIIVRPMDAEKCEHTLRAIWRGDFEQGIKDFVDAMNVQPQIRDLLLEEQYEMTLQNNPALIASIVSAWRRKQGRR